MGSEREKKGSREAGAASPGICFKMRRYLPARVAPLEIIRPAAAPGRTEPVRPSSWSSLPGTSLLAAEAKLVGLTMLTDISATISGPGEIVQDVFHQLGLGIA
jgi:hypothetical protein